MFADVAARFATLPDTEMPTVAVHGQEQREHQRFYFQALAAATIHPPAGQASGAPQTCYVLARDISQGGVSVLHPVPLQKGQVIDLQFADGRNCSAEIRWCRQVESHCHMMGCKFV
jgi:hypothetical protein